MRLLDVDAISRPTDPVHALAARTNDAFGTTVTTWAPFALMMDEWSTGPPTALRIGLGPTDD